MRCYNNVSSDVSPWPQLQFVHSGVENAAVDNLTLLIQQMEDAEVGRHTGITTEAPTLHASTAHAGPGGPPAVLWDMSLVASYSAPQPPSQVPSSSDSHVSKEKGKNSCDADGEVLHGRVLINMQGAQSTLHTDNEQPSQPPLALAATSRIPIMEHPIDSPDLRHSCRSALAGAHADNYTTHTPLAVT